MFELFTETQRSSTSYRDINLTEKQSTVFFFAKLPSKISSSASEVKSVFPPRGISFKPPLQSLWKLQGKLKISQHQN